MSERACIRCATSLPATEEFFYLKNARAGRKSALMSVCKTCHKASQRQRNTQVLDYADAEVRARFAILADDDGRDAKVCAKCSVQHPLGEFIRSNVTGRLDSRCAPCRVVDNATLRAKPERRAKNKAYQQRTYWAEPEAHRERALSEMFRRKYGLTIPQIEARKSERDHRCDICRRECKGDGVGALCVDHDHDTGAVRGMLCTSCNRGLGLFHDDERSLAAAISYLLAHRKRDAA